MTGKPVKENKEELIAGVKDFLSKNPLSAVVAIKDKMDKERELRKKKANVGVAKRKKKGRKVDCLQMNFLRK
jgi:hypothetical protein